MDSETKYFPVKNDIWLCKRVYDDRLGESMSFIEDYLVFITTNVENIHGDSFIRVQPISKKIEYRTEEDILITDTKLTGDPFIIETWNEQPILIDILDKKIGSIDELLINIRVPDNYTKDQLDFRKDEIRRSAYLRQSTLSALAWQEQNENRSGFIRNPKFILSIAAIFVGCVIILWQPAKLSNEQFYKKYAVNYSATIEYKEQSDQILRGNNAIITGFSISESEVIQVALANFEEGKFENAVKLLSTIQELDNRNHLLFFTYAISQLYAGQVSEAILSFELLLKVEELSFTSDLKYYLAIAYTKQGKASKARKIIKSITDESVLQADQRDMLRDLRRF